MSLDKFQLPPLLIPQLYRDSLVVLDGKQPNNESLKAEKIIFLGGCRKNILILVKDSTALHLNDKEIEFLAGILSACKLSMADVALVNTFLWTEDDFSSYSTKLNPRVIILFDVDAKKIALPIQLENYKIETKNKTEHLAAPSLKYIAENKEEKKKLWECLKTIFSI